MKHLRVRMENLPKAEEYQELHVQTHDYTLALEKGLLVNGAFTEKYIVLQGLYRILFGQYLIKKTGIEGLDQKIREYGLVSFRESSKRMDFYQKYDGMHLDYIYLRNFVHIERLKEREIQLLASLLDRRTPERAAAAGKLIEKTFHKILAFADDEYSREISLFPSSYGEGNIPVDAIVFMINTASEKEEKTEEFLLHLKGQMEQILSLKLRAPVKVFIL